MCECEDCKDLKAQFDEQKVINAFRYTRELEEELQGMTVLQQNKYMELIIENNRLNEKLKKYDKYAECLGKAFYELAEQLE